MLSTSDTEQLIHSLLTDENLAVFEREHEFDFAFNWQDHARDARQRLPPAGIVGSAGPFLNQIDSDLGTIVVP